MKNYACILKTERLILREIREDDTAQIVIWRSSPDVYQYFKSPHALTEEEHLHWYRNLYLPDTDRLDWICLESALEKPVGVFSLRKVLDFPGTVEVSYLIAPEEQRKGYAAEAIRELIRYAAEIWNAAAVIAEIHENNLPSVHLVQKLGFVFRKKDGLFCIYELIIKNKSSDGKRKEGLICSISALI